MAKDSFHGPLEQIDPCCWRIPKSYRPDMRVDGLIFANDKLIRYLVQDQAPEQVANVATLPGIQLASLAMPDIHWGYGFCIGGVAATDPAEGGVISPGGVGYDINCLSFKSRILDQLGFVRPIGDMARAASESELACVRMQARQLHSTAVRWWMAGPPQHPMVRVHLASGDSLEATTEHPFWTPDGMVPLRELRPGSRVGFLPFDGVPFEPPSHEVLVSEDDFIHMADRFCPQHQGNSRQQMLAYLRRHGLLPLRLDAPEVPYLCKLLGFVFGDGNLHFSAGKGVTSFYGEPADLEDIRVDVARFGVQPSRVYCRQRLHHIHNGYRPYQFQREESWFKVVSTGFALLLACLGAPVGKKSSQDYLPPAWLDRAPRWLKRLFLASLFGAELSTPSPLTGQPRLFRPPTLSMNKRPEQADSGQAFLHKISDWLREFGISTQALHRREVPCVRGEPAVRFNLILSPRPRNLQRLYGQIGFEYNRKRRSFAALVHQYLKHKKRLRAGHRVDDLPTFAEFCEQAAQDAGQSPLVWERIAAIEPIASPEQVYDFQVEDSDHNFIANGFVVSNCGVRLVRSNLFYREVKPHLRTLIDSLFKKIPTGAGKTGKYRFDQRELQQLMGEGSSYLIDRELAFASDLEHTEAQGRLDGADPSLVSRKALERGAEQCGTLGSGNHFLEVQRVDHIFDETAAAVMGLEQDMICVMIHSGSRGLGYQVCDDALADLRRVPEKYGIVLPDRQLACAPADSPEGRRYIAAMRAAANYAWCNRQLLMMQAREVFAEVFGRTWQQLQMNLVYDVCHNIAKLEEHTINGVRKKVWVHRKGATRAFPPGHPEVPAIYRGIGQPVIIPGDMGRASWVLVGQPGSMERTFGTTCHGAGRLLSRTAAVRDTGNRRIDRELESQGIIARAQSRKGLAEEQPNAYKNVDEVVSVVDEAGLSKRVARLRPLGVIKG